MRVKASLRPPLETTIFEPTEEFTQVVEMTNVFYSIYGDASGDFYGMVGLVVPPAVTEIAGVWFAPASGLRKAPKTKELAIQAVHLLDSIPFTLRAEVDPANKTNCKFAQFLGFTQIGATENGALYERRVQ